MNILTGLHSDRNSTVVTIFYTYYSTTTDPQQIIKAPGKGAKKCEMFKRGYIKKLTFFENGVTIKFKEPGTTVRNLEEKSFKTFKVHLHPQRIKKQVYTLADVAQACGLSGLRVTEYFSNVLENINFEDFKKTG